jgi:hypothetical protein
MRGPSNQIVPLQAEVLKPAPSYPGKSRQSRLEASALPNGTSWAFTPWQVGDFIGFGK